MCGEPFFLWRLNLENKVSELVQKLKPAITETTAAFQRVALLWSLSVHTAASYTAQSTQSKVGVFSTLSTTVSGFCNPRNNLSFPGEFKNRKSIEVRLKKSSLLKKLIRTYLAVEVHQLFLIRVPTIHCQNWWVLQAEQILLAAWHYVQAFIIKPMGFTVLADPPTLLAQSKNTFQP